MSAGTSVRKIMRGHKPHLLIDFYYLDSLGRRRRFRKYSDVANISAARAEAQRLLALAAATGNPIEAPAKSETFGKFVDGTWRKLFCPKYRPATRRRYFELIGQGIGQHFGSLPLAVIDAQCVRAFMAKLATRKIQVRPHVSLVSVILKAAVETGALAAMPKLPPAPRRSNKLADCPDTSEVQALLAGPHGWLHLAIALAAFAGLRSGEVRALEVRDIDFKQGLIRIRRAISDCEVLTPKSGHERSVPIAPELLEQLELGCKRKLPTARVVLTDEGRTPTRQRVYDCMVAACRRSGIGRRSFHSLRHHFCSSLLRRGATVEDVRIVAGHSNLATTARYLHSTVDQVRLIMCGPHMGHSMEHG